MNILFVLKFSELQFSCNSFIPILFPIQLSGGLKGSCFINSEIDPYPESNTEIVKIFNNLFSKMEILTH